MSGAPPADPALPLLGTPREGDAQHLPEFRGWVPALWTQFQDWSKSLGARHCRDRSHRGRRERLCQQEWRAWQFPSFAPPLWSPWNLLPTLHRLKFFYQTSPGMLLCSEPLGTLRALTLLRPPKTGSGLSHLCFGIRAVPAALVEKKNLWICPALPQNNCSAPHCNPSRVWLHPLCQRV